MCAGVYNFFKFVICHACIYAAGAHAGKPVKFGTEPDLQDEECHELLLQNMPEHVRRTKITQKLFIK